MSKPLAFPRADVPESRAPRAMFGNAKYLDSFQAATYLGYDARYANPRKAFMATADRLGPTKLPRKHYGRRVMFLKADLERILDARGKSQEAR